MSAVRRCAAALPLVLAALLVTGCQARMAVEVAVDADGSGTLGVTLAADDALQRRAAEAGSDPLRDLAAAAEGLDGWEVADRTGEDGARRVMLAATFTDPEGFTRLAGQLQGALDAPEVTLLEGLALVVDDETIRFEATASLTPTAAVTDVGLQPDQAVALIRDADAFAYELRVTLPGEVLDATGQVDNEARTVTWTVPPGETVAAVAVGARPGPPVLLLVAFAAAGGLGALLLGRRLIRRR